MSGAAWPGAGLLLPTAGAAARRARSLWWMYLLVIFALAGTGAGAAQAWFDTHDSRDVLAMTACEKANGINVFHPALPVSKAVQSELTACTAPYLHQQGMAVLAGAVLGPAAAWLLMLCGGLGARWRVRRSRTELAPTPAAQAAAGRFGTWCDAWNLTGRRRPRLRLAAPGTCAAQAFTTGLPFGRPLVVMPLSYAHADPATFDVVVLHELAHVRSRDLTWASSVWWAGWLILPVMLAALSGLLVHPGVLMTFYGSSLWLAAGLSATVLVLRAGLLRQRELAADRDATDMMGDTGALRGALGYEPGSAGPVPAGGGAPRPGTGIAARAGRRVRNYVRAMAASHPSPAVRASADPAAPDRWDGGFAVTAATSLLAMFTFQGIDQVLKDLFPVAQTDAALAAASLLWACVAVPAWTRRAEAAARAGARPAWRGPLAGAVLGLTAGYCLPVPGAALDSNQAAAFAGHVPLLVTLLVIVTAGAGVLAAGAAASVAEAIRSGRGRALALAGAVLAVAAALTTALSVAPGILFLQLQLRSTAADRYLLAGLGDDNEWRFTPLLVLAGLALASRPVRVAAGTAGIRPARRWRRLAQVAGQLMPRACRPVIAAATVAGGTVAALSWQFRFRAGLPPDTLYLLVYQRFWICALAGWAAAACIVLTGRAAGRPTGHPRRVPAAELPVALNAGFLTAALAGLLQWAWVAAAGDQRSLYHLQQSVRMPMWLLFVVAAVTLPWLLLAAGLAGRGWPDPRPASRTAAVAAALGSGLAAAALSLALLGGILSSLTIAPDDSRNAAQASSPFVSRYASRPVPAVATLPAAPAGLSRATMDPGRRIRPAAVATMLADIPQRLPADATPGPSAPDEPNRSRPGPGPITCQDLFIPGYQFLGVNAETAANTRSYTIPARGTSDGIGLAASLTSSVTPMRNFTTDWNQVAHCHHYTIPGRDPQHISVSSAPLAGLPYSAGQLDLVDTTTYRAGLGVVKTLIDFVMVGHNLISAGVVDGYDIFSHGSARPPAAVQRYPNQLAATVLDAIIENLRSAH